MRRSFASALLCTLLLAAPAAAQSNMDYGPFLSATFQTPWPKHNTVLRGVAVHFDAPIPGEPAPKEGGKFAKAGVAGIIFDTELLRYAAGWTGGFIKLQGVAFDGAHGTNPSPAGKQLLGTLPGPGWANKEGSLKDPRELPHGPLPRDWARYKGLYRHDNGVVFSYTVGDCQILDMPTVEVVGKFRLFCRTLNLKASSQPLVMVVADVEGGKGGDCGASTTGPAGKGK